MTNSTLTKQIPDWTKVEFKGLSEISVLYCRLSAEDANEGESNSISNQRLILSKLAEQENLSNPIVFYQLSNKLWHWIKTTKFRLLW